MKAITTLALLISALHLFRPGDVPAQVQQIRFESLTVEDGLSHAAVTSITQDHQGFMWFGTHDGLNKYDGYTFTIYRHDEEDSTSVSSSYIESLLVDREGLLWVGTWGAGLNRFDPAAETFQRYRHDKNNPQSLSDDYVTRLYEDREGTLWVGTLAGGLNRFDPEIEAFIHHRHDPDDPESLSDDNVRAIYEDREGTLWIGTGDPWRTAADRGGGLNRFDREKGIFKRYQHDPADPNSLIDNRVWALLEDSEGTFWVGTWGDGLHRFDRERETFTRLPQDPSDPGSLSRPHLRESIVDPNQALSPGITFIHEASGHPGSLWIGAINGGVDRYDYTSKTITHYEHSLNNPFSPVSNLVWSLFEDRQGILWISYLAGGISKVDPRSSRFPLFQHDSRNANSLSPGAVSALYEDRSGILWIGTSDGLNRFDRQNDLFTHYRHDPESPNSLSDNLVRAILEDRDGMMWIGTSGGGLNRFNPETDTFAHFRHDPADSTTISSNTVSRLLEDREGNLWIGTNAGLNRFDRSTETFVRYHYAPPYPTGLTNIDVSALYEDDGGTLWLGSIGWGGLIRHDPETETLSRVLPEVENISTIYQDDVGVIWLGTAESGLFRFDPHTGTSERYTGEAGVVSAGIWGILGDDDGNLWLRTEYGLSRLTPSTGAMRTFGMADGLQGLDFSFDTGSAYYKSQSGELFFGGANGFNAFYPDQIQANPHPPAVVFTGLRVARQPVRTGTAPLHRHISALDALELSHRQNDFTLEFAALHFSRPEENQYAYMLEGYDRGWHEAGTERSASYMNLPPDDYTFRVRASNYDGVWNEEGRSLRVRILPPWWRTWWAYVLYGLILASGVFVVDRVQRRRLIRSERERAEREAEKLRAEAAEAWANYLQSENLRQTQELEHARALQLSMLPDELPEHPMVEIAAHMQTATEVGGDYYDFHLSDDGTLTFAIGDATGHGVQAGTVVTAMKGLFNVFSREHDLERVLQASSRALRGMHLPKLYMALALGKLHKNRLKLIGAGMPPALIYRPASGCVDEVPLKGAPLGSGFDYPYEVREVMLSPGDTLVLMSDGFPELRGKTGEMFGYERAARVVEAVADESPEEIIAHLAERAKTWCNGQALDDDMTFVVMRVKA